jgi:hypothetical protein
MSRTIRQRKDDLLTAIRNRKSVPVPFIKNNPLYDEYKKILWTNGIKDETLIETQLTRMILAGLPKAWVYSNLKFMSLFRSRLAEEGIPYKDVDLILTHVVFDMSDVNEDDDYIGDVALEYAELCKLYYDNIVSATKDGIREIDPTTNRVYAEKFNILNLKLPE